MKRYPGIRPFTAEDAPLFYGREEEKRDLFQMAILNDIVVLFGKSGTGKSSLLNAGVCPQFADRNLHPVFIRLNNTAIAPEQQVYEHLREHDYIPEALPAGLTLWEYFKHFWYVDLRETFTPVVILDQFEELFTLYTPEERKNFVDQFADMVNGRMPTSLEQKINAPNTRLDKDIDWPTPPNVKFILSIRSDYLYLLNELSTDIPSILRTRFELHTLNRSNALQAITLPAMAAGVFESPTFQYEENALREIVEVLGKKEVDQLRSDLPESDLEIEAFQLQLFCQQIENKIIEEKQPAGFTVTSSFFGGKTGIQQIIGEFYQGVISRVPEQYQVGVETMVATYLIRNKRRIIMEESAIREEYGIPQQLLDQLHDERLLRKEARAGSFYYEISHDTLLEPVLVSYQHIADRLEKERLEQEQLAKEKELAAIKQKAAAEQKRAEEQSRLREQAQNNAIRARQQTRIARLVSALALLLALFAGWSYWQASVSEAKAKEQTQIANDKTKETKATLQQLEAEKKQTEAAKNDAIDKEKLAQQKTKEAQTNLAKAQAANEKVVLSILEDADAAILNLDYLKALEKTNTAAELEVQEEEVAKRYHELAFFFTETGQYDRAEQTLQKISTKNKSISANRTLLPSGKIPTGQRRALLTRIHDFHPAWYQQLLERYYPQMVFIKGDTFTMGTDNLRRGDELPNHEATVSDFYMAKTETTVWQYMLYANATNRPPEKTPNWQWSGDNPVVYVSWYDAIAYSNWVSRQWMLDTVYQVNTSMDDPNELHDEYDEGINWNNRFDTTANGLRLPTETEWEFAARGGKYKSPWIYSGSNEPDSVAWYYDNSNSRTQPVAHRDKSPNALGLYDMSGNVWEWCWDWKGNYKKDKTYNNIGPDEGSNRVRRGGSWNNSPYVFLRCTNRYSIVSLPYGRNDDDGFRLSRAAP